ncbi:eukaryotic translation initiation factor 1A, Y-chromosomal-like [Clavelina lepadiformis]|uniref:eukaryotic translation initiation factor 1A, Y-chromosomal-like n=1 Tax=Clavelina lepadiformis TaxID=159417 RepID=UPI0040417EE2
MPKNKGKGGKNRRRGKNENDREKRELVFKEDGQEYAQVIKMLGNGRLEALCFDGTKRLCHIRGKLRKKVWINQSDIILIGLRDYQDHKADVIMKYTAEEARNLKLYGELPDNAKINDNFAQDDEHDITFDDISSNVVPAQNEENLFGSSDESEEEEDSEEDEGGGGSFYKAPPISKSDKMKQKGGALLDVDGI